LELPGLRLTALPAWEPRPAPELVAGRGTLEPWPSAWGLRCDSGLASGAAISAGRHRGRPPRLWNDCAFPRNECVLRLGSGLAPQQRGDFLPGNSSHARAPSPWRPYGVHPPVHTGFGNPDCYTRIRQKVGGADAAGRFEFPNQGLGVDHRQIEKNEVSNLSPCYVKKFPKKLRGQPRVPLVGTRFAARKAGLARKTHVGWNG